MKKVTKLVGIVSRALQMRYLICGEQERDALKPLIERESEWMIKRMAHKGYQLEPTVSEVYGLFTRGPAIGTLTPSGSKEV